MNKNQIINKAIGLTMVIGSFIMLIIYYLVDWDVCSINLPKIPANMWLIPIWIGGVISLYRPNLSKTAKVLSWAAIGLFCISILTMCLSHGTKIFQAAEIAFLISGILGIIAWAKMYSELKSLDKEKEKN